MKHFKLFILLFIGLVTINVTAQITDYLSVHKPNYYKVYKHSFAQPKDYAINKTSFKYNKGDFWIWFDKQPMIVKASPTLLFNTTIFIAANNTMNKAGRTQDPALREAYRNTYDKLVFTWVASIPLQFIYTKVMIWNRNEKNNNSLQSSYKIYKY